MFGNIGMIDRVLRGLAGIGLGVYAFMFQSPIFAVLSFLIISMASFKWCPLYHLFGINTDSCNLALSNKKSVLEGFIVSLLLYLFILITYLLYRYYSIVEQPLNLTV